MRLVELIGVASGLGAQNRGCSDGPLILRELGVFRSEEVPTAWDGMLRPREAAGSLVEVDAELCVRLAQEVRRALQAGRFPLVVGGDHSCAVGTWSGVHLWLDGRGPLGLIWIDAHMDSHTFATTPSGALHGMPLACLLGVRSYEEGEAALLQKLGVRVISMEEIRRRGIEAALAEAMDIARDGTAGYGVSLDLDVLDPVEEPGVGSPVPGGLLCCELERALHQLRGGAGLLAMEIVEYNPYCDHEQLTAKAAGMLFRAVVSPTIPSGG